MHPNNSLPISPQSSWQRQKQAKKSITQNKGRIILDDIQAEDTVETKWWIVRLNLLDSDKEILSSDAWLNGSIISACQVILALASLQVNQGFKILYMALILLWITIFKHRVLSKFCMTLIGITG